MGRRKRHETVKHTMPPDQHRDLVVFTALLMGAEFQEKHPSYWVANDGWSSGISRFQCARSWLWRKGMVVRVDGTIYVNENLSDEEKHHVP
jgi:hypothetical protein